MREMPSKGKTSAAVRTLHDTARATARMSPARAVHVHADKNFRMDSAAGRGKRASVLQTIPESDYKNLSQFHITSVQVGTWEGQKSQRVTNKSQNLVPRFDTTAPTFSENRRRRQLRHFSPDRRRKIIVDPRPLSFQSNLQLDRHSRSLKLTSLRD